MFLYASLSERAKGVLLMLGAAVCFSTAGILVRNVKSVDAIGIVLWRSVFMFLFILSVLAVWHRGRLAQRIRDAGRPGILSACFLGATFFFFIFAITRTTIADASALMSTGPLFLAVAAWAFLGERPRLATWIAIGAALCGVALMFGDGLGSGRLAGNMLALGVPACFTVNYIVLRRASATVDPTVAAMLAALFSAIVALPLAWPGSFALRDLPLLMALGVFQTGLGLVLMTRAYRRLSAGELGLLALIEPVLAPLWVWIGIGERPGAAALAGAATVIGAVLINQIFALRWRPPVPLAGRARET